MVSIMSIGAGSVGVSARPALPTTMSTSGNRHRTMSRAFRSSTDSVTEALGTVIGMSMTIPSSSGVRNSRAERRHHRVGRQGDDHQERRPDDGSPPARARAAPSATIARKRIAQEDRAAAHRGEAEEERHAQDAAPGPPGRSIR